MGRPCWHKNQLWYWRLCRYSTRLRIIASYFSMNAVRYFQVGQSGLESSKWQRQSQGHFFGKWLIRGNGCESCTRTMSWSMRFPNSVFENHLFENARLYFGKVNVGALKSVVHFLRMLKKSGLPWITRHSAFIPRLFINSIIPESSSATPPP